MEREELMTMVRRGPVRIRMNDGGVYDVPSLEMITVSDISAYVLYRATDGKLKAIALPLVTMSGVEEVS